MEYSFGTRGDREVLRTKGSAHSGLTGYRQIERAYPGQTITDNFRVVRRLDSQEDAEGNCYDWYEIDRHWRTTDKSAELNERIDEVARETEDALCEQDAAMDERMTAIEDAVCELDAALNG